MRKVLLIPGDGVGRRLADAAESTLSTAAPEVEVVRGDIGFDAYERTGVYLPADTLDLIRECGHVFCGPLTPVRDGSGAPVSLLDSMKVSLDLYATVRSFRTLAEGRGVPGVDVTLWASNTVAGQDVSEARDMDGIAISKYIRSSSYSRMMARALTDLELSGRSRVCCVTRDDLFPESSGMFAESFEELFDPSLYSLDRMSVQTWASRVVRDPLAHDFIVCVDLYSHVAAGILAGLTGGNHLSPVGFAGDSVLMMVPGLTQTYAGVDPATVNTTSALVSCSMLLRDMGMADAADSIVSALSEAYAAGDVTPELGGPLDSATFTDRVVSRI